MGDLGELDQQAAKARENRGGALPRTGVGPSRVGARSSVVQLPPPADQAAAAPAAAQPVQVSPQAVRTAAIDEVVAPSTISLDRKSDEVLEAVRAAGRFAKPKVDANRSATIRLALSLMAEQMTPDQIVAELRKRAPKAGASTGRKRLG